MSPQNSIRLSLLDNSHAFLREAVRKALAAQSDISQWQFAILSLVQSLELSLKAMLHAVHPVLVFDNIDSPKHTVSPMQALKRLENPSIASVKISDNERRQIENAISFRNKLMHSDFELSSEFATAKFFEILAFVIYFQGRHLNTEVEDIVGTTDFDAVIILAKNNRELCEKAERRIAEEGILSDCVLECPNCGEHTFVTENAIDTCYTCRYAESVTVCSHCESQYFEWQLESFESELDIDLCEGRGFVRNSYGYNDFKGCPDCVQRIKNDIQEQRERDDYYRAMEEEYYWRKRNG